MKTVTWNIPVHLARNIAGVVEDIRENSIKELINSIESNDEKDDDDLYFLGMLYQHLSIMNEFLKFAEVENAKIVDGEEAVPVNPRKGELS